MMLRAFLFRVIGPPIALGTSYGRATGNARDFSGLLRSHALNPLRKRRESPTQPHPPNRPIPSPCRAATRPKHAQTDRIQTPQHETRDRPIRRRPVSRRGKPAWPRRKLTSSRSRLALAWRKRRSKQGKPPAWFGISDTGRLPFFPPCPRGLCGEDEIPLIG